MSCSIWAQCVGHLVRRNEELNRLHIDLGRHLQIAMFALAHVERRYTSIARQVLQRAQNQIRIETY